MAHKIMLGTVNIQSAINIIKLAELAIWADADGTGQRFATRSEIVRFVVDTFHEMLEVRGLLKVGVNSPQEALEVLQKLGIPIMQLKQERAPVRRHLAEMINPAEHFKQREFFQRALEYQEDQCVQVRKSRPIVKNPVTNHTQKDNDPPQLTAEEKLRQVYDPKKDCGFVITEELKKAMLGDCVDVDDEKKGGDTNDS